jgi:glycosyl transferase family 87
MRTILRDGSWLTADRVRVYCLLLSFMPLLALSAWVFLSSGGLDPFGRPIGTDFSNVYAAGRMVLDGNAPAAYDPALHYAEQQAVFGSEEVPFYGWHYPPPFLGVAALLALFPYSAALAVWMATTLPAYLLSIRSILPGNGVMLAAIAFPAVFVNFGHGQNGFLTAALLGGGLVLLNPRPVLAGVLFGALAYKPQFGVFIPLVLVITGRWTTIFAATATVLAFFGAAWLGFGTRIYTAFLESTEFTRKIVLETGNTGWEKIQSLFSAIRHWGGSIEFAYTLQLAFAALLAILLIRLWRSDASFALKAAGLATASLLATPYAMDYDMMALAPAIAFTVAHGRRHGFIDWERTGLALVAVSPLIARSVSQYTTIPLGFIAMAALMLLIIRRANRDTAEAPATTPAALGAAE